MREDVEAIKPYLPDSKLDDELYKIKRKFDNQLKKDNLDIIKTLEVGATSLDSYQEKFQKQFAKISEANKASLAEYVQQHILSLPTTYTRYTSSFNNIY